MAIREGHGKGQGTPHIEVPKAKDLPLGVAVPVSDWSHVERTPDGKLTTAGARALQLAGARARKGRKQLATELGLKALPDTAEFRPYKGHAVAFRRASCQELAQTVGGGVCGSIPSSIVASAALALAWSRYLSDKAALTGDAQLAAQSMRASEVSRQHLMAAQELCAKQALARAQAVSHVDPLTAIRAQLGEMDPK